MTEEGKRRAKPIIFSTEMVEAILDGRKTRTRRVVHYDIANRFDVNKDGSVYGYQNPSTGDCFEAADVAPYKVGDILWVRETFAKIDSSLAQDLTLNEYAYVYKANENGRAWESETEDWKWKSPMFMPKEAARIFLRVTDVRPERVQDITPQDVLAEGIINEICARCLEINGSCIPQSDVDVFCGNDEQLIGQYVDLWDSLNAKRGYSFESNPFVWVHEFEVAEINGEVRNEANL